MADTAAPSVSVVVPTYKRRELLERTVRPLLDSSALEVIVVVDGVDDGSMELLRSWSTTSPKLRPVWRENGGDCAARQTGLEQARGEVVLFLDDDVIAAPGLVEGHAAAHARRLGLVVLGYMPTAVPVPRRPGQFATYLYSAEYEGRCRGYEADSADVLEHLWAGNVSLRRHDALQVGMSAPDFNGGYHADQAFGLRCAAHGLTGVFDRALAAEHVHVRGLAAFVRDARAQGSGRVRLAAAHPEAVLPPQDQDFLVGLPGPLRAAASRPSLLAPACAGLEVATRVLGGVGLYRAETAAARLLRRYEQVRGAREERARTGAARARVRMAQP